MRAAIIRHTAHSFDPDIFIVDKEPMGLRGELEETLEFLKARGSTLVLGLRDVMDSPELLEAEWRRNDMMGKITDLDHIWVYGPRISVTRSPGSMSRHRLHRASATPAFSSAPCRSRPRARKPSTATISWSPRAAAATASISSSRRCCL